MLEVHTEQINYNSLIARREFNDRPTMRNAMVENRGRRFIVTTPLVMTAADKTTLLDMRSQGFNIEIRRETTAGTS